MDGEKFLGGGSCGDGWREEVMSREWRESRRFVSSRTTRENEENVFKRVALYFSPIKGDEGIKRLYKK